MHFLRDYVLAKAVWINVLFDTNLADWIVLDINNEFG
jgi:hypothetical protein